MRAKCMRHPSTDELAALPVCSNGRECDDGFFGVHGDTLNRVIAQVAGRLRIRQASRADFAQDVRLYFVEHGARLVARFDGRAKKSTYFYSIVLRMGYKWARREVRVLACPAEVRGVYADTRESLVATRVRRVAATVVAQLSRESRLLLHLRYVCEVPVAQIASQMGTTQAAVYNKIARIVTHLRWQLDHSEARSDIRSLLNEVNESWLEGALSIGNGHVVWAAIGTVQNWRAR